MPLLCTAPSGVSSGGHGQGPGCESRDAVRPAPARTASQHARIAALETVRPCFPRLVFPEVRTAVSRSSWTRRATSSVARIEFPVMKGTRLSPLERLVLQDIETGLQRDRRFDRVMHAPRRREPVSVAVALLRGGLRRPHGRWGTAFLRAPSGVVTTNSRSSVPNRSPGCRADMVCGSGSRSASGLGDRWDQDRMAMRSDRTLQGEDTPGRGSPQPFGAPCWVSLRARDLRAAEDFYGACWAGSGSRAPVR